MVTVPLTIVATSTARTAARMQVHHDDHPPPIETIRGDASDHAEQEDRQVLAQQGQRDQERVMGLGGDEERPGGDHDAVPGVVDEGRRQEPAEAHAKPVWRDRFDRAGRQAGAILHALMLRSAARMDAGFVLSSSRPGTGMRPDPARRCRVAAYRARSGLRQQRATLDRRIRVWAALDDDGGDRQQPRRATGAAATLVRSGRVDHRADAAWGYDALEARAAPGAAPGRAALG